MSMIEMLRFMDVRNRHRESCMKNISTLAQKNIFFIQFEIKDLQVIINVSACLSHL